jgi:DNA-binding XRE family transcriptional regulator
MVSSTTPPRRALRTSAAAQYLGVLPSLLRKKRLQGPGDPQDPGPAYIQFSPSLVATVSSSRKDMDLTQEELAKHMGWSREVLSNIEQGRRSVTVADLILIARALNLDPETLFRRVLRWQRVTAVFIYRER